MFGLDKQVPSPQLTLCCALIRCEKPEDVARKRGIKRERSSELLSPEIHHSVVSNSLNTRREALPTCYIETEASQSFTCPLYWR
jgi:hypothetical protein